MRKLLFFTLAIAANVANGQGLFLESNFSDTQFTVRARALDIVTADMPDPMSTALLTELKILDVYHGDLAKGDIINLIIESDALKNYYRLALLQGEFLTSFCQSDTGVYYTNILFTPAKENVQALEHYREHGTEDWDRHDCDYTNEKVDDPDDLNYTAPVPEYPASHSTLKWREDKNFMSAYHAEIQKYDIEDWTRDLDGIGYSRNLYEIDGDEWLHITLCKITDCHYLNLSLLYNRQQAKVFALINSEKTFFTGDPTTEIMSSLITLHDRVFSKFSIEKRLYNPDYYVEIRNQQMQAARKKTSSTEKTINTLVDVYIKQ